MKKSNNASRNLNPKSILPDYITRANPNWLQEYEGLDNLSAKLDTMIWEINCIRHLVEQKMADLDQLFIPSIE